VLCRFLFDTDPLWLLSIHLFLCLPSLLVPDTNVANAFAANLELSICFTFPNHCSLRLCIFRTSVSPFDLNPVWCLYSSSSVSCLLQLVSLTIAFLLQIFYFHLFSWGSNILLRSEILIEQKLRIRWFSFGLSRVCLSIFSSVLWTLKMPSQFYMVSFSHDSCLVSNVPKYINCFTGS